MNRREALFSALGAAAAFSAPGAFAQNRGGNVSVKDARRLQDSTILIDGLDPSGLTERYLGMLEAAGVDVWHQSMGGIDSFVSLLHFCDRYSNRITQVKSVRDIRRAHKDGKVGHLSGWQAAHPLISDGGPTMPAIRNLRMYHELGLRIVGINYNVQDSFGGGAWAPTVPLSAAGRRLVEEIHKLNIVLDVGGHTGDQTSWDAIEMSKGMPIICSHTNLRALVDNPRNMTDRMIEAIARTGGTIGLTTINDFHARSRKDEKIPLTPQVALDKHLDQYDYLKRLVGVDHIALGPDFMFDRPDISVIIPELWPPIAHSNNPPWFMVKDYEVITDLPNVTQGLMQRGWTDAELKKVLGGNLLRVYEKVWGA
ncbi:dipeptidase [Sphingosinicella rhizophila]|uniref:Membrane dipeptidase n=1 Tax=Sphingosinicella rhizophila TaxID=3050082 RepID=A0ABU3Q614_9SPHN|nr:membrane dipeptidase [Sphingosinicella sp. GR2756]MDT9598853.1 membrane dipeptidase [Sphingosinicella sp. GR2756]